MELPDTRARQRNCRANGGAMNYELGKRSVEWRDSRLGGGEWTGCTQPGGMLRGETRAHEASALTLDRQYGGWVQPRRIEHHRLIQTLVDRIAKVLARLEGHLIENYTSTARASGRLS